jgi:hypothetical protein
VLAHMLLKPYFHSALKLQRIEPRKAKAVSDVSHEKHNVGTGE